MIILDKKVLAQEVERNYPPAPGLIYVVLRP